MPSNPDVPNLDHRCTKHMTVPHLRTENWAKFSWSAFKVIFLTFQLGGKFWPFLSNFLISFMFSKNLCNFLWPFWDIWQFFFTFFGLVSPVTCAKILLCAGYSAALTCQVQPKSCYAGQTPFPLIFMAQSGHHTGHIWDSVYLTSLVPGSAQAILPRMPTKISYLFTSGQTWLRLG